MENSTALDPASDGAADSRWELAQRVASSGTFGKSHRLREFLLFVCKRALRKPDDVAHEQEIGTAVFGRKSPFDPSHDSVVRVHGSQLRKRLEQYFSTEGKDEPVVIEIPRGTYMPIFRPREPRIDPSDDAVGRAAGGRRGGVHPAWRAVAAGLAVAVLVLAGAWLPERNRAPGRRAAAKMDDRPAVHALWRQMFANGRPTSIVLADANLTMFQDLIRRPLSPLEYQRQQFDALAEAQLQDPVSLEMGKRLMKRELTTMVDVGLAHRLSLLNAEHGIPTEILLARHAGPRQLKGHNAILSGSRRANPWVELFEDRLNFRSRFVEEPRSASFENVAPRAGEARVYAAAWDRLGYCRVAYLPNLDGTGSVLLLSGTDMVSSDAGLEFITDERWVRQLRAALAVDAERPVPHFEALLRAELVISASPRFEMIAHRVVRP